MVNSQTKGSLTSKDKIYVIFSLLFCINILWNIGEISILSVVNSHSMLDL